MNYSNTAGLLVLASAFALSACGGEATGGGVAVDDPSDPEQIAAALEGMKKPQPGEYSVSAELVDFEMVGASDEEANAMRSIMELGMQSGSTFCMTEEMAQEGYDDYLDNLQGPNENCEYDSFSVNGDEIEASMTCNDPAGGSGTLQFSGTITETSSSIRVAMDMEDSASGQGLKMTLANTTERVGDCSQ